MPSSNASEAHVAVVHGLRLHTPFEVWPGADHAQRQWSHEVRVRLQAVSQVNAEPRGDLIARAMENGELMYAFTRAKARVEFAFPQLCCGHFDFETAELELCAVDIDVAKLVLPNTVLAVLIGQAGDMTLHASAVVIEGQVLAFCGPSTFGKTTCAAALGLAGASAVTDDLLRVELSAGNPITCYPGVPEFRLRTTYDWALAAERVRPLADGRTGFTPGRVTDEKSPLGAIFFPRIGDPGSAIEVNRVQGEAAVRRVLQSARVAWTPRVGAAFLKQASTLASRVQLFELRLELSQLKRASYVEQLADVVRAASKQVSP